MWADLRVTLRALASQPGFTIVVILTLALGLGASSAVFGVVDRVLLAPLPFADPDRVIVLGEFSPTSDTRFVSPVTFDDWKTRNQGFDEIAAFRYWETVNLEDVGVEPEPITLVTASENFFRVLGVQPLMGRTYREEQSARGGSEAVISHELWQRRYASDPGILGRAISIRGTSTTIVGVMPPMPAAMAIGRGDVWTCLYRYDIQQQRATRYRSRYLTVLGRLAPGVTLAQATTRMEALQRQLWTEPSSVADGYDVRLQPIAEVLNGSARLPLFVVSGAVIVLLLVAAANVATLMLVRAASRRRDTATRLALGARPGRIVRLVWIESTVLALAGGLMGLGGAWAALRASIAIGTPFPQMAHAGVSPTMVGFTLVAALITAALCAVVPMSELGRLDVAGVLKESGRSGTASRRASQVRQVLVALQVAMACLLLIVGSLLVRSFINLLRVDPGFDAARAVYFDLYLPGSRYPDAASHTRFYREMERRLTAAPGVEAAGALLYFPYKPKLWLNSIEVDGQPVDKGQEPVVYYNQVAGRYFEAMGIRLLSGRLPSEREMWDDGAAPVVLVNRALSRRLFGEGDPIGHRLRSADGNAWSEIIGVVGDVRQQRLDAPAAPEYYSTFRQMPMPFQSVVVRGRAERPVSIAGIREVMKQLDPGVALANLMPLDRWVTLHTRERQFALWVLSCFAVLALTLGAIGVYGAISYGVAQRRREMGIRLALGATPKGVRALILADGVRVVIAGTAAGIVSALVVTPLLRRLLFGMGPFDPVVYLTIPLLLVAVAVAACWWPARAAARVEVTQALRID